MPQLQHRYRGGSDRTGGIVGYPLERLHAEVAYIAYYLHWSRMDVLVMEHPERHRWIKEIADINRRLNHGES